MPDNFYFSGLDNQRWLDEHFDLDWLLGYVSSSARLKAYKLKKPFWRLVAEVVLPSVSLTSFLPKLIGIDLKLGKTDPKVAKQIIDLINELENKRLVGEFLLLAQKRCKMEQHFFDSVGSQFNRNRAVISESSQAMNDRLIVVEGQLVHRSTVTQFAPNSAQQLQASTNEWFLGDFPPHGMVERNGRFKGDLLLLKEDPGFSDAFADYIPFCRGIGWYPYCRITGFYDSSRKITEVFPELEIAFVEYRPPKLYTASGNAILDFLDRETNNPIYLKDWSDRLAAAYLLPLITLASNMEDYRPTEEQQKKLQRFQSSVGSDMPSHLVDWYRSATTK